MAKKTDSGYIPEVDVIKSGVNVDIDLYSKVRNSEGNIVIGASKKNKNNQEELIAKEYKDKEKEFKEIKEKLELLNMSKDDIKEILKKKKKKDKKKKKKDKKKKRFDSSDSYMSAFAESSPKDLSDFLSGKDKKKKKKKHKLEGLVLKEKKKKNSDGQSSHKDEKDDKGKSEVAQRFKEVEKITRENIKEIDSTIDVVNERIADIMRSSDRVRGKDTALANYLSAKTNLISTRQKAATDILSNRAKVYEIEMKKEKSANDLASNDADMIARLFPGIAMNGSMETSIKDYIGKNGKNKDGKKKKKKGLNKSGGFVYQDNAEALPKREKELLKSGDLKYSDYDKNIEYEGKFDVAIKKAFTTGEWKFIAVDRDGSILDIPKSMLPSKKVAQMKFDDEKDVAIDMNTNRAYKVFSVPTI